MDMCPNNYDAGINILILNPTQTEKDWFLDNLDSFTLTP